MENDSEVEMPNAALDSAKRRFFDLTLTIQCLANHKGYFVAVNPALLNALRYDETALLAKPFIEFVHLDDREATSEAFNQLLRVKSLDSFENRYRRSDGSYIWLRWSTYCDDDGLVYGSAVDITVQKSLRNELAQAEQSLRERESWYRGIVESQLDLVCRHLSDTTLTYANDAYCRFWGKTREEIIGQSFLLIADEADESLRTVRAVIAQLLHDPRPIVSETHAQAADGSFVWVQWVSHGITDADGNVTMIQAVGRDITQLKQLEAERLRAHTLEAELAKQREISQLRERFSSLVSHEFRTPLSVMLSSVSTVQQYYDRYSRERVLEKLGTVEGQVHRMIELMDDVLILTGAETSSQIHSVEIDIISFCRTIIDTLRLTDHKRHCFTLGTDGAHLIARIDRRMLEHIVLNLIANAIKYSPPNSQIDIEIYREGEVFIFRCADHGIGIPASDLPKIFEPFYRANNVDEVEGTGLGLAIVKRSVELLGGDIQVESQTGVGTRFTVRLPLN